MTAHTDNDLGYTDICAGLSARFGTRFCLEVTGECTTMVVQIRGGIELMITDCGVSLSAVEAHLNGRAAGYYVGVHRVPENLDGLDADDFQQLGYACDVEAPPTAGAIGELVHQAFAYAQFLRERT